MGKIDNTTNSDRRLHTSVDAGKSLARELYGKPHAKSYYLGCSLGGRQGIKSAEEFPNDFDGIVAGAPAIDFNNLVSWRARFFTITGAIGSTDFISATAWKTWIHDEAVRHDRQGEGWYHRGSNVVQV